MRAIAVIPAAGSGARLACNTAKALVKLANGELIIERTLNTLRKAYNFESVIITVPATEKSQFERFTDAKTSLIVGGENRSASVKNALRYVAESSAAESTDCLVLIHDAARCMVSTSLVQQCLSAAQNCGAVVAAVPVVDTVREVSSDQMSSRTLDRQRLFAVQTPQVFKFELLSRALAEFSGDASDEAQLVERIAPVAIVRGEHANIKITYQEDLMLVNSLL